MKNSISVVLVATFLLGASIPSRILKSSAPLYPE